jgi:multiphosphoryl transfer protein
MRTLRVTVRFPHGLHARPAARLVHLFRAFRSRVFLRFGNHVANAGSLLSILLLSATFDTQLEVQATGEDEDAAIQAAEVFFQTEEEKAVQQIQIAEPPGSPPAKSY